MINKKVRGATEVVYDGIHFKSKFEGKVYLKLKAMGYAPLYEPDTIVLREGFRPKTPWSMDGRDVVCKNGTAVKEQSTKYTPDFRIVFPEGFILYVEAKGHPNDRYPLIRKLFLEWLQSHDNTLFAEVHTLTGVERLMNQIEQKRKNKENNQ